MSSNKEEFCVFLSFCTHRQANNSENLFLVEAQHLSFINRLQSGRRTISVWCQKKKTQLKIYVFSSFEDANVRSPQIHHQDEVKFGKWFSVRRKINVSVVKKLSCNNFQIFLSNKLFNELDVTPFPPPVSSREHKFPLAQFHIQCSEMQSDFNLISCEPIAAVRWRRRKGQ